MSKLSINSEEEYNQLVTMYNSNGFALYQQLIAGEIMKNYQAMLKGGVNLEDTLGKIRGLTIAETIAYNIIKENEEKYAK